MSRIKEMVEKGKKVTFCYYREGELWYITECGFKFPVPITDVNGACVKNQDKALLFMRWIRRHLSYLDKAKEENY